MLDNKVGWKVSESKCLLLFRTRSINQRSLCSLPSDPPVSYLGDAQCTPGDKPHAKSRPHTLCCWSFHGALVKSMHWAK